MIIDMRKKSILDHSNIDSEREAENIVSEAFKKSKVMDETNSLIVTEDNNEPNYEEESFAKEEEFGSKKQSQI